MKAIEKYYIYGEKKEQIQINDKNTVKEVRCTQIIINKEAQQN